MNGKTMAVQRMQDYIISHIADEITLADLARAASFSPWYAHRLFRELTGVPVSDYIRKLRLTEAAKRLKSERCRITGLAMELGFESIDGFTRAFVREFGMTPSEYRLHPVPITHFIAYDVKFRELKKEKVSMENVRNVFIQVIFKPERKVIIKRGVSADEYWAYCNEVGCDVWGLLMSMDSLCGEPVCLWLPERYIAPNTSKYVQGVEVEVDYNGIIPEGFDLVEFAESDYLLFRSEPYNDEDFGSAILDVQKVIEEYDYQKNGSEIDTNNPRIQLEPICTRGYVEMVPVR